MHNDLCHGKVGLCDEMTPTKGEELLKYLRKVDFKGIILYIEFYLDCFHKLNALLEKWEFRKFVITWIKTYLRHLHNIIMFKASVVINSSSIITAMDQLGTI